MGWSETEDTGYAHTTTPAIEGTGYVEYVMSGSTQPNTTLEGKASKAQDHQSLKRSQHAGAASDDDTDDDVTTNRSGSMHAAVAGGQPGVAGVQGKDLGPDAARSGADLAKAWHNHWLWQRGIAGACELMQLPPVPLPAQYFGLAGEPSGLTSGLLPSQWRALWRVQPPQPLVGSDYAAGPQPAGAMYALEAVRRIRKGEQFAPSSRVVQRALQPGAARAPSQQQQQQQCHMSQDSAHLAPGQQLLPMEWDLCLPCASCVHQRHLQADTLPAMQFASVRSGAVRVHLEVSPAGSAWAVPARAAEAPMPDLDMLTKPMWESAAARASAHARKPHMDHVWTGQSRAAHALPAPPAPHDGAAAAPADQAAPAVAPDGSVSVSWVVQSSCSAKQAHPLLHGFGLVPLSAAARAALMAGEEEVTSDSTAPGSDGTCRQREPPAAPAASSSQPQCSSCIFVRSRLQVTAVGPVELASSCLDTRAQRAISQPIALACQVPAIAQALRGMSTGLGVPTHTLAALAACILQGRPSTTCLADAVLPHGTAMPGLLFVLRGHVHITQQGLVHTCASTAGSTCIQKVAQLLPVEAAELSGCISQAAMLQPHFLQSTLCVSACQACNASPAWITQLAASACQLWCVPHAALEHTIQQDRDFWRNIVDAVRG